MRIIPSVSYRLKRATTTTLKKTTIGISLVALLAGGVLFGQNILQHPKAAYATATPDSCFAFDAGTGTITDYGSDTSTTPRGIGTCPTAVDIPSTIGGVGVTRIGSIDWAGTWAFWCKNLTSITIPNSVTSIGSGAFSNNQLTTVTIPNSVTSIGDIAFTGNQLASVTIPTSVTSLGSQVFAYNQLTTLPDYFSQPSVSTIPGFMFQGNKFATLTIPGNITTIGNGAFSYNQLTAITIPNSVTSIGDFAFTYNQLTAVTILNPTVAAQGDSFVSNPIESVTLGATTYTPLASDVALTDCLNFDATTGTINGYFSYSIPVLQSAHVLCGGNVTTVNIPSSIGGVPLTAIGDGAFEYLSLASVTIPDSVTSIGNYAFEANNLTSITIPAGMTTIGDEAFAINKITRVTIPNNITSIDPTAFFGQNPWGGTVDLGTDPAHDWYSDNPAVRKLVFDNIWYARLYTADPTNPNGLKDGITDESWYIGEDINGDGDQHDSIGGHLINPSSATINYRSAAGTDLAPASTLTGHLTDSTDLTDYLIKNVQTPDFVDSQNPTPTEQTALNQALAAYTRSGTSKTFTPPTIPTYVTPATQTKALAAGDNTIDFTYAKQVLSVPFTDNTVINGTLEPSTTPTTVTSSLLTQSDLSIANDGASSTVQSASLLAPNTVTAPSGITMLGGLNFTLTCTTGATTTITYTLGAQTDIAKLHVYKYQGSTSTLTDITKQVTITNETMNGTTKTIIRYSLTDGTGFDEDGVVNGAIVDPLYVGVVATTSTNDSLANTGTNTWLLVAAGLLLVVAGAAVVSLKRKARNP